MIEIRKVRITWFVETGFCDEGGIGYWSGTKESVPCETEAEARSLRDKWIADGKLKKTLWGEFRPPFYYGMFRIRKHEEVIDVNEALE